MKTMDHSLSTILNLPVDIMPTIIDQEKNLPIKVEDEPVSKQSEQIEMDSEFVRTQIYDVIDKGNEAINGIQNLARESMHPRAFEVLAQMLKTQSDNIDKLMKLHKDKKDLSVTEKREENTPQNINVEKAVFVGSTTDLLKRLKNNEDNEE